MVAILSGGGDCALLRRGAPALKWRVLWSSTPRMPERSCSALKSVPLHIISRNSPGSSLVCNFLQCGGFNFEISTSSVPLHNKSRHAPVAFLLCVSGLWIQLQTMLGNALLFSV